MSLEFAHDDNNYEPYVFPRGPSNVLLVLVEGDSHLWPGLEVEELLYTEGDADIENEASMLEDALSECIKGGNHEARSLSN